MSEHSPDPSDPFGHLPPELRAMLEQLGGPDALRQMQQLLFGAGQVEGPVDWELARRVALQLAAEDDRPPTDTERADADRAVSLAEHWLDATPLPAPPDAGRLVVDSRQGWVNAAVDSMRPLVDPVATAAVDALGDLAREQMSDLDELGMPGLEQLLGGMGGMGGLDLSQFLRPVGAAMMGLQAGQVIGALSKQLLAGYELGIPTAPRSQIHWLAGNLTETFEGWDLDASEVAVVIALHEAAHRRLYHAVPWLEAHVQSLVALFAAGTVVDADRLGAISQEVMQGVDPDDPDSLQEAMQRAASFRLEPTAEQQRVLERLQGVVCLVRAWARHEAARAMENRVPAAGRIEEVLRRRRATKGDGEELLASLLGLDLQPTDEAVGERFVAAIEEALGPEGLQRALAHPENLPDTEELGEPARWLDRMATDAEIPDDPSALFGDLGDAPVERTADERRAEREAETGEDDGDDGDGDVSP